MLDSATAEIIPFPARLTQSAPAPQMPAELTPTELRLKSALISLNDALTEQRTAIEAWKSALGELRSATGRLGSSLRTYHDSLGQLGAKVAELRTEAVKLEAWADDTLAHKG